jgi:undecaprenyl-diphosphatase
MSWFESIVLGLVQGLTEFLPVSSSGHLVLAESLLGVQTPGVLVEVALHVATLGAVCIVYARRIRDIVMHTEWRTMLLLVLATLPAVGVGLFLKDLVEQAFDSVALVGMDLLVTGIILWSTRWVRPPTRVEPTPVGALGIGLAQALAILPGISRSGSTVAAGTWLGLDPVRAAEFSFLMAIPAIAGAAVLQIPDLVGGAGPGIARGPLAAGFVAAMVAGVWAIHWLVQLLARGAFWRFAPYCWLVGGGALVWTLLR